MTYWTDLPASTAGCGARFLGGGPTFSSPYNLGGIPSQPLCLLTAHFVFVVTAGTLTGVTFSDNMTGLGWATVPPAIYNPVPNVYSVWGYKVMTVDDYLILQSGPTVPSVSATTTGASAFGVSWVNGALYDTRWYWDAVGPDIHAATTAHQARLGVPTIVTLTSAVGSSVPSSDDGVTDQLIIASSIPYNGGSSFINLTHSSFQASPLAPVPIAGIVEAAGSAFGGPFVDDGYAQGLAQCSPTAANNVWTIEIQGGSSDPANDVVIRAASFHYGNTDARTVMWA